MTGLSDYQSVTYHNVYVVCMHLSQRQTIDGFDACRHHPKHPPGLSILPGFLALFRS